MDDPEADESPLINLTPLIDVVFVVLITFIIIAPILDIDKVELASASESAQPKQAATIPLSITVREDNSIWVEGRLITLSELKTWLIKERERQPTSTPKLIHDKRAQFGTYQAIKNALEECGFEEMDLLVKP